jgi:carbon starvation protein CstA
MIALVISVAALIGAASRRFAWFCVVPTVLTVVIQVLTSLLDNRNDNVTLGFEWIHLLGLVIVVLLVLEVRPTKREHGVAGRR